MKRLWLWAREVRWIAVLAVMFCLLGVGLAVLSGNWPLVILNSAIAGVAFSLLALRR